MCYVGRQPVYMNFIAFYLNFCMEADFLHVLPFRHHRWMHGTAFRRHVAVLPYMLGQLKTVNKEVIPHFLFMPFMTFVVEILGDTSYTGLWGSVLSVAKEVAVRDAF